MCIRDSLYALFAGIICDFLKGSDYYIPVFFIVNLERIVESVKSQPYGYDLASQRLACICGFLTQPDRLPAYSAVCSCKFPLHEFISTEPEGNAVDSQACLLYTSRCV